MPLRRARLPPHHAGAQALAAVQPQRLPRPAAALADWRLGALQAALQPLCAGIEVHAQAECDSTNTRLLERARGGDGAPCLLVAEHQGAGRGRLGRPWFSDPPEPGSGPPALTFSIGLRLAPADWSGLSLAVGVALAEALGPAVRLKWPNDLCLPDAAAAGLRKLGGVLIETLPLADSTGAARHAVIGIGLNLAVPAARDGLDQPVAGWRELEPQARAAALLPRLAVALLQALTRFEADGLAPFAARYAARDALAGRSVQTGAPAGLSGRAEGIDDRGALRLHTAGGLRLLQSGEVTGVRPC